MGCFNFASTSWHLDTFPDGADQGAAPVMEVVNLLGIQPFHSWGGPLCRTDLVRNFIWSDLGRWCAYSRIRLCCTASPRRFQVLVAQPPRSELLAPELHFAAAGGHDRPCTQNALSRGLCLWLWEGITGSRTCLGWQRRRCWPFLLGHDMTGTIQAQAESLVSMAWSTPSPPPRIERIGLVGPQLTAHTAWTLG